MAILCMGVNHQSTNVSLRERLTFDEESAKAALSRLGCGRAECMSELSELAILSTCNRVEFYAVASQPDFAVLELFLEDARRVPSFEFYPHLYRFYGSEAVTHLFSVAAGLDSLILGEPQILGQVAHALGMARGQGAAGRVLTRLFQAAIHTGKRARTETRISQNPATISSMAVRLIGEVAGNVARCRIVVLGAGEMAELAVKALIKRGATQVHVVNRTMQRAQELAEKWGGAPTTFEQLLEVLEKADVLIASTGAPHFVVYKKMVEGVMKSRPERPLVIMDIAVPRNVDPEVGDIPGVALYDMDALSDSLEDALAQRTREVPQVEHIIEEERAEFMKFLNELDVVPLIAGLRQRADLIRLQELERTFRRMPDLTPEEKDRVTALTKTIVKKLLHLPTARLRDQINGPYAAEYANLARQLFGLESNE